MEPAAKLFDDLIGEILHRVSLVCKRWRRILADPAFLCRHRALHRTPPILGFLCVVSSKAPYASRFIPSSPASRLPAGCDLPGWRVLDCRHGRALFATPAQIPGTIGALDLVVWDPLTDEQRRLPRPSPPPAIGAIFNAAVLCAAVACDHRGCHGGSFRVALLLLASWAPATGFVTSARVFSSETGDWSELISVQSHILSVDPNPCPSALVGDALYFRSTHSYALEYQLGEQRLLVIDPPPQPMYKQNPIFLMSKEDGGLGFASVELEPFQNLHLWSRETGPDGVARWARSRAIDLKMLLPNGALALGAPLLDVVGFAEGTDVIFVAVRTHGHTDIYMVQLNSGRSAKVSEGYGKVFPYTSFCIPVMDTRSQVRDQEKVVEVRDKLKLLVRQFLNQAGIVSRRLRGCMSSLCW